MDAEVVKLKASAIQTITLTALKAVAAHVMPSTPVALSCEPDDENYDSSVQVNTFVVGVIMSKKQALAFRTACNLNNVWIKWTFWEIKGDMSRFEYSITATEVNPLWAKGTKAIGFALGLYGYWLLVQYGVL